jgi:hexulose-6-phosphate isomerase
VQVVQANAGHFLIDGRGSIRKEVSEMRKAIMANTFPAGMPLADQFHVSAETGFAGIEIGLAREGFFSIDGDPADTDTVARLAHETGLTISGMLAGPLGQIPPTSNDPSVRAEAVRVVRRTIEVAPHLGVDTLLLVPGRVEVDVPYGVAWDRALAFVRELIPDCERHGITLAVENVWNRMIYSPIEMRHFVETIGHPLVGVYWDAGNHAPYTWPQHWPPVLGNHIRRVHVKGFNTNAGPTWPGFVRLLDGTIDWPAVMASLRAIGYDGWVTIEIGFGGANQSPAEILRKAREFSADMDTLLSM